MTSARRSWLAAVAVLALTGCGFGYYGIPVRVFPPTRDRPRPVPRQDVRARIDERGGMIEHHGVRLEVPAGALRGEIEVVLRPGTGCRAPERPDAPTFGWPLAFRPAMRSLGAPFVLSIPEHARDPGIDADHVAITDGVVYTPMRREHDRLVVRLTELRARCLWFVSMSPRTSHRSRSTGSPPWSS